MRLVAARVVIDVRHDDADRHAEELVDLPHPLAVAAGEIIVDGDDMDALAGQRVEVAGQRRDERLAFTGAHFGDLAVMQDHAAHQLYIKVAHTDRKSVV